jgi:hypothetical protein
MCEELCLLQSLILGLGEKMMTLIIRSTKHVYSPLGKYSIIEFSNIFENWGETPYYH